MTPEQRIDAALDRILHASGSYPCDGRSPDKLKNMRKEMWKIMEESYIEGFSAAQEMRAPRIKT